MFPTVPIDCPFVTFSPSVTNSEVNKFAYTVSNPFWCSITIVNPYLGSFLIVFTVPASAAFTTVVFWACISIPTCVVHSCNVCEYIKFSFANSFVISPSTGFSNDNSFWFVSSFLSVAACEFVFAASLLLLLVLVLLFDSFALLLVLSVFTLLVVLFVTLFAKFELVLEVELEISLFVCALLVSFSFSSTLFPIDVLALWLFELLPSTKLAILLHLICFLAPHYLEIYYT